MTEKELRAMVCQRAEGWLGLKEADGGHRPIIDLYNTIRPLPRGYKMSYTDPWCAAFVSAVGEDCGLGSIIFPECSCQLMIELYKAAGRWEEQDFAVPRLGDLIMYDWDDSGYGDCTGAADHVGVITAINGNILRVIEGNVSDSVGKRSLYLDSRYIRGYCQPDYARAASEEEPPTQSAAPSQSPQSESVGGAGSALILPQLSRGSSGESVRAAQLLLIGRGCRCGPWGADGDFGDATYGGTVRFQRGRKLEADGVIGPITWRALLGL